MSQPARFETRHTYTIHGKIGSGGMGTIRLGLQLVTRGFSRVVAIKQIHATYANNQEVVAMFRNELRVASRIVHPNVVPILDVMSMDDELSLIMEYVHGLSVARLLASTGHAPSPEIACTIMIGVLHGLHAAHEALSEDGECLNIVHRDVTPHNVMVGVDGTPRVLDFGIAHALGHSRTTVGPIKGKARYLAPEQLARGSIDRRADIYSASLVFWEMLTGGPLFRSGRDRESIEGASEGASRHPVESLHLLRAGISPRLSRIVLRGLQPDREARYATALEMAVALEESAATVSTTKVGQWVRQVWGNAELVRLQQIRAIEGSARATPEPDDDEGDDEGDDDGPRGRDQEWMTMNGDHAVAWEAPYALMTVTGPPRRRLAPASGAEPTIAGVPDDSLFGSRRELTPLIQRRGRNPDKPRAETPPAGSPWPVNGQVSPARKKERVATLAAVLVALGSALALFVMRGSILRATGAPISASRDRAADLQATPPAHIRSVPVIEMTPPPLDSRLPPEGEAAPDGGALRGNTPGPARPVPAAAAVVAPNSKPRVAQAPRRRSTSAGRAAPSTGLAVPRGPKVPRRSPRTASAKAIGESAEEAGAAQPPVLAAPSCDPPYVVDDEGIKRFKLSCL